MALFEVARAPVVVSVLSAFIDLYQYPRVGLTLRVMTERDLVGCAVYSCYAKNSEDHREDGQSRYQ